LAATSTIPQLGFIHEDSASAFCLDIADLFRESVCLPAAFRAVRQFERDRNEPLERHARRTAGRALHDEQVISSMIDRIKALFADEGASAVPPSARATDERGGASTTSTP
jgi:CRISPR-associated protein Cas1